MPMFACLSFGSDSRGFDWILKLANRTIFRVVTSTTGTCGYAPAGLFGYAHFGADSVADESFVLLNVT